MKRRAFLAILAAAGPALARAGTVEADDPAAPHGGNESGDVLVVAFFDYNCPFCRRAEPELRRFIETDGRIRLVYKDWPVLSDASVVGARLALAAAYQGRYETAHRALMAAPGRRIALDQMRAILQGAGIDMTRLDADAAGHAGEIGAQLARNDAHARELGLTAVPAILVGGRRVVGGFDQENFSEFAALARGGAPGR
ncbi:DsbA family protein [Methylobacterium sp. C25]|uniref:DsbA family protein n=1 Tax=Methylobacterium sp. C25 TaxID=2721622 RepID=UPI001F30CD37|nr:DsbA family protein [Methylobacterium sp. C25]MCE4224681.1 DsbA family protein [Methylobacterium sp. C25]